MFGRCLGLITLGLLCLSAFGSPNSDLNTNLKTRLHTLPQGGKLIKSFTNHSQSYIYDQALAIIAFTKQDDQENAKDLLHALSNLQKIDGSLYFSYYLNGESPYPVEGDKRYAGAIAWVALAAITYQHKFKSKEFLGFNSQVLKYLETQMKPVLIDGKTLKAISFSPTDISETIWNESETAALEHNLDAYSAFLHFSEVNNHEKWKIHAAELKNFIMAMWDSSRSHFWSGANLKNGIVNKQELYLDNQTWSLLALDENILKDLNTKDALNLNCDQFLVEHEGVTGFMDSKPAKRPASSEFVWSEGTAGQILAMTRHNDLNKETLTCKGHKTTNFLDNIKKMKKEDGGIAYSTSTPNPDFTTSSSVAGTVWYYFASNNINPFHLDQHN
jgi:hypothetical protein